jgi:ferredoxin
MALRIEIDPERCMGSGNCSFWAPGTFDLGDDGLAHVVDAEGDGDDRILLAGEGCPTRAIAIYRSSGERLV